MEMRFLINVYYIKHFTIVNLLYYQSRHFVILFFFLLLASNLSKKNLAFIFVLVVLFSPSFAFLSFVQPPPPFFFFYLFALFYKQCGADPSHLGVFFFSCYLWCVNVCLVLFRHNPRLTPILQSSENAVQNHSTSYCNDQL